MQRAASATFVSNATASQTFPVQQFTAAASNKSDNAADQLEPAHPPTQNPVSTPQCVLAQLEQGFRSQGTHRFSAHAPQKYHAQTTPRHDATQPAHHRSQGEINHAAAALQPADICSACA